MSQYGNEFTNAVKTAREQLAGGQPTNSPTATAGNPLDVLLEVLSGVPQAVIMSQLGDALKSATTGEVVTTVTPPVEGGGGGIGGGGGQPIRRAPEEIKQTMTTASAPMIDTQAVIDGAIWPNTAFHIGAVITTGVISIIGELLSIGQIDKILEPLLSFIDLTDAPAVYTGVRQIRLDNQVFTPYRYYVNNQNPIQIPPYADLIRLRVREDRLGLPLISQAEFIQQMRYSGFSEFWSNVLWDAHFSLPSNNELFTMYNYGFISKEDLKKQLIVNDIAPEWVDRITEIAKRFPTMPELRMMARRLPMKPELVTTALKAQGIREEYYNYYVSMFQDWDVDSIRGRRQTAIVKSYVDGYLTDEEFSTVAANTHASINEGSELLLEAQWKRYSRRMDDRQKTIIKLYSKRLVTREEAEGVLITLGFEPVDIDHWLDYTSATLEEIPAIETTTEESIEGLESAEARTLKFTEWLKLQPPVIFPPEE